MSRSVSGLCGNRLSAVGLEIKDLAVNRLHKTPPWIKGKQWFLSVMVALE